MGTLSAVRRTMMLGLACALMAMGAAGCGSKSSSTAGSLHTAGAGQSSGSSKSTGSGGASASSGSCPSGDTQGVINGKHKCLHVGQICSHKPAAIAAYPKYRFACTQVNGTYRLKKA